jgi:hypothetical protein
MESVTPDRRGQNIHEIALRHDPIINVDDVALLVNVDRVGMHLLVSIDVYHVPIGCLESVS